MSEFHLKKGDVLPAIEVQLIGMDKQPLQGMSGAAVYFVMSTSAGAVLVNYAPAEVVDEEQAIVRYAWQPGDTDTAGRHLCEWYVQDADGKAQHVPNAGFDYVNILNPAAPPP